jgi:hypothetical protein
MAALGSFVLSERAVNVLIPLACDSLQFYPVTIRYREEILSVRYYIMHVVHTLDCADPEQSYPIEPPYVRPVIIQERVPKHIMVFHVKDAVGYIVVRSNVRSAMLRAKLTGCMFFNP